MMTDYVPDRFRRAIVRHMLGVSHLELYPQILGIVGRPGDGKSFQTRAVLNSIGYQQVTSSASELQGQHEGDAVRAFDSLYDRALEIKKCGSPCAVVVEDFDTSIANIKPGLSYGVNSQLVSSRLMNLAEGSIDIRPSDRCPIIFTANNVAGLYGPLLRPGRINFFQWEPSIHETEKMIDAVLRSFAMSLDGFAKETAQKFNGISVATVRAAIQEVVADALVDSFDANGSQGYATDALRNLKISQDVLTGSIALHHKSYQDHVEVDPSRVRSFRRGKRDKNSD